MQSKEFYTLRQVANLTGLTEFTLRGWEGRYQAFKPDRTDTGRRQYSKSDLKRAFLLRELTNLGHRISNIAHLGNSTLEKKLSTPKTEVQTFESDSSEEVEEIFKLVFLQDWDQLKTTLAKRVSDKNPALAIENVILPVLAAIGKNVDSKRIGIAQEHILSALIKEQLYSLLSKVSNKTKKNNTISVVIATPEGDFHEIGILIAHVLLNDLGIRSLYLGPNTPKAELCETILRFGASHVLLASSIGRKNGTKEELFSYLHFLDQHLPKTVDIWAGGRNFEKTSLNLHRNFKIIKTFKDLPQLIKKSLNSKRG